MEDNEYNPLVSIIIPVYKGENYMRTAIDSALGQTYKNIEVIVINDGSPDNGETEKIAKSYGNKIKYFYKENGGCASAINYGLTLMQGDWFSWLSHDDVYEPTKIEEEIKCIIENRLPEDSTVVSCEAFIIDENGNRILHPTMKDHGYYDSAAFLNRLLIDHHLNGCGLLIPTKMMKKAGSFSEKYIYVLDWEYWIRLALLGGSLYRIGERNLVSNRVHSKQVTVKGPDIYQKECYSVTDSLVSSVINSKRIDLIEIVYSYVVKKGYSDLAKKIESLNIIDNNRRSRLKIRANVKRYRQKILDFTKKIYWRVVRNA